eukprot:912552-Pyramimonas_sp.AAC.1
MGSARDVPYAGLRPWAIPSGNASTRWTPTTTGSGKARSCGLKLHTISPTRCTWSCGSVPCSRVRDVPLPPPWGDQQWPDYLNWNGPDMLPDLTVPPHQRIISKMAFLDGSVSSTDAQIARAG